VLIADKAGMIVAHCGTVFRPVEFFSSARLTNA
jgi:hypothetical protein